MHPIYYASHPSNIQAIALSRSTALRYVASVECTPFNVRAQPPLSTIAVDEMSLSHHMADCKHCSRPAVAVAAQAESLLRVIVSHIITSASVATIIAALVLVLS